MRLKSVEFRGVTRFTGAEPISLNFDALPAGLIALVGRNGEGKTTAAEAPAAALYKAFPSRPGFYENFSGKDAFISATFEDRGHEIEARVVVDAERRVTEGYVLVDAEAATDGKAASFEAAVLDHFGSYPLFLASVFASQNKAGNFLGLKKGDRKTLFLELLDLGYLELLSQAARDRAATVETDLRVGRLRIADTQVEVEQLPAAEQALADGTAGVEVAVGALDRARQEEAASVGALERARTAGQRIAALAAAEASARSALIESERAMDTARREPDRIAARRAERIAAIAALKAEELAPAVERRAKERREAIAARHIEDMEPIARNRYAEANCAVDRERASMEKALVDVPDAREARERLGQYESERREVEAAGEALRKLQEAHRAAVSTVDAAEKALARANAARAAEVARLERQAGLLGAVPCRPMPEISAGCQLLSDARGAAEKLDALRAAPIPEDGECARVIGACIDAAGVLDAAEAGELARAERLAELKAAEIEARNDVAKAQAAGALRQQITRLDERAAAADRQLEADLKAARLAADGAMCETERLELDLTVAIQAARVAVAQAIADAAAVEGEAAAAHDAAIEAMGVAAGNVDRAKAAYEDAYLAIRGARMELGILDVGKADRNAAIARAERESAERTVRQADQACAAARARVNYLLGIRETTERAQYSLRVDEEELSDWRALERGLGKDGIQALEIDAAGPEVAQLTNELLTACYGPRFSLTFETTRTKRDGGQMEVFDVRVFDGPRERPVEALSGGERVIVSEAVGLAFAIYNSRKSGIRWETFWRDETAGALDPENAGHYVQMLRRARELAGAHQIIFVSHQSEVYEQADARLIVEGGRVEQEGRAA